MWARWLSVAALVALSLRSIACGESFSAPAGGAGATGGSTSGASGSTSDSSAGDGGSAPGTGGSEPGSGGSAGGNDSGTSSDADPGDAQPSAPIPADGLLLWLRADHGLTEANGGVAIWEDQSGNALHATQTASNVRPKVIAQAIGGLPSVEFDGVDDFMRLPAGFDEFSRGVSIFATVQHLPVSACNALVELSNGSEIDDISFGEFNEALYYEVFDQYSSGAALPSGTPQLLAVVHRTNLTFEIRRNGQLAGEGTAFLPGLVTREQNFVGRSLYANCVVFPGRIAELIVYARAVSDVELLTIEAYLRARWACCND